MLNNPIVQRELVGALRTRKAVVALIVTAVLFAALIALRWPTDARVDLSGMQSQQVFRLFGYGLLTAMLSLVPVFPATSIVQEKQQGTLVLLLNSPMRPWAIYGGKFAGHLVFVLLLMAMSFPSAAACYAMGGVSLGNEILPLYGLLVLVAVQYTALALLVSTWANSTDSALRITYGCVLLMAVVALGPHFFLQGSSGVKAYLADGLRCLSPIPAVMEILGNGAAGARGIGSSTDVARCYVQMAVVTTAAFVTLTISRLNHRLFDRTRWQGVITEDRSAPARWMRRMVFLVDPQRRKPLIGPLVNPVMVKEFRCRRFGRMHWLMRLAAASALVSLLLTYAATMGTLDWGVETIGGIMVLLQAALIVVLTPSLAASLITAEKESGGWQLLQMTQLSGFRILVGKLASVFWPVLLILISTLPGYVVMVYIKPELWLEIRQVLICLSLTGLLAMAVSVAASSLFSRTAIATAAAYGVLGFVCAGTMLVWVLRDTPFGHRTVERTLTINPIAAALSVIRAPGFAPYALIPNNWYFVLGACGVLGLVVSLQLYRLMRPQ
ncbi:MAG: ABC transporter permease [Planctomycetes bacterium]|nr:ABC transporter permease [Planctomycetota bacterium]